MSDTDATADSGEFITVQVTAPDGMLTPQIISVTYEPETVDQFERVIAGFGGATFFRVIDTFAYARLPGAVSVFVHQPRELEPAKPEPTTFMREFQERIKGAKAFKARLEAAA